MTSRGIKTRPILADEDIEIYLGGDQDEIFEYESEYYDSCFNVDWRGEFEELLREINDRLPDDDEVLVEQGAKSLTLVCGVKRAKIAAHDQLVFLRAFDRVIGHAGMRLRIFTDSLGSDTFKVLLRSSDWWNAMDQRYRSELETLFIRPKDVDDS